MLHAIGNQPKTQNNLEKPKISNTFCLLELFSFWKIVRKLLEKHRYYSVRFSFNNFSNFQEVFKKVAAVICLSICSHRGFYSYSFETL